MTDEELKELDRLKAEYITPVIDRIYTRVMNGEPLTYVEIGIWNMAAGPEMQIRATGLSALTPPMTGPGANYADAPKIPDGQ